MNLRQLVLAAIPMSIMLIVLALGLRGTFDQAVSLFRQPLLLLRSLLAINVVLPLAAAVFVAVTHLNPAVEIALVALAVSPIPPMLPGKELKLVSDEGYVYGMLVAVSLLSIVTVPVALTLLDLYFGRDVRVDPATVARIVATSVLLPLTVGMTLRYLWPGVAARLSPVANAVGLLLLVGLSVVVLAAGWDALRSLIGDGAFFACAGMAAVGLVVGHVLGGPEPDHQTVLALATSSRHPGVAVAIGGAASPGDPQVAVAVVLYVLVSVLVAVPYTAWRRRRSGNSGNRFRSSSVRPSI